MNYKTYIRSKEWKQRRQSFYEETGVGFCFVCGTDKNLHLHHKTYERLGRERNEDLVALCGKCHFICHDLVEMFPDLTIETVAKRLRNSARKTRDWRKECRTLK